MQTENLQKTLWFRHSGLGGKLYNSEIVASLRRLFIAVFARADMLQSKVSGPLWCPSWPLFILAKQKMNSGMKLMFLLNLRQALSRVYSIPVLVLVY